ncbi:MAG: C4-dicarboxylate ABC transporter permease [Rhizobiaceae bacterium]|nr:C4-dicarboxylate ABC transporter permease [Rhizobiaceae bacterium]|tara:strand:+ start:266 stop:1570 length:1305 start_codon:yes stop_codon:yes gene_type:complete
MTTLAATVLLLGLLIVTLGAGIWIFSALLIVSIASLYLGLGFSPDRIGAIASKVVANKAVSWELAAVPIFLWMGEIILRTDLSQRLFRGLSPLVARIPGGLIHTNVLGCTVFAAISGSGTATTATVGKITIPELTRRGYNTSLSVGSLAGAGSFGLLIPPSIAMIVYGVLAEVSITRLFAAGVLPGLMMAGLFSGYIALRSAISRHKPEDAADRMTMRILFASMRDLMPITLVMVVVLGSIYSGLATPSEAAAVGLAIAMVIAGIGRQLSRRMLLETLLNAVRVSTMLCVLIATSSLLSACLAYMNLPEEIKIWFSQAAFSPYMLLFVLALLYIVMGMFLDGTSITVMTVPIVLPVVVAAGFDPIWFGVFLIIMIELSALTPPIGLNLFILQGLTGRAINRVTLDALPFFLLMCFGTLILTLFPIIALWLPSLL